MSDDLSPVLSLPLILPAQAQKHVTHNEALRMLDVLVQLSVASRSQTAPPVLPVAGGRWIVPPGATGAWAGQTGAIALFDGDGWSFFPPQPGWRAHVGDEGQQAVWADGLWRSDADLPRRFARVGINTDADAVNRLAVASEASLFSHDGAGHRLTLNKAGTADTASLLFQTGWSGRAEIGTAGTDDLVIKVSADGAGWTEALRVDRATGALSAPSGLLAGQITGPAVTQSGRDRTADRLVKVGDYGLGGAQPLSGSTTLEALELPPGNYSYVTGAALGGGPETGMWPHALQVLENGSAASGSQRRRMYVSARISTSLSSSRVWVGFNAGTAPITWTPLPVGAFLVGSVSQSGGQATGAVIERGANANGEYTRWADGTQDCWRSLTGLTGAARTWTFPAAFSAPPVVTGTAEAAVLSAVCLDSAPGTIGATLSARDATGARRADTMHLVARGRWY